MSTMLDLGPAARQLASLLQGITDDQLTAPTPCDEITLGDLIDHIGGLSQAFTGAALKDLGTVTSQGPSADAARLGDDWRTRVPDQLAGLAEAWRSPDAWEGMTAAGGVDLTGEMAGRFALNELVIHGWDVARASGQPFDVDPRALEVSLQLVTPLADPEQAAGRDGLFGPAVAVPADAPLLDRLIGLSGRDPAWSPVRV